MTLILAIVSSETIWLLSDWRLSTTKGVANDAATKVMVLETTDGFAIAGYAGLGATSLGTEPSEWMSSVLRGTNLPLEQSLSVLADAMKRQFPKHLFQFPKNTQAGQYVIIPAIVNGESRLYSIDFVFSTDRMKSMFRFTRWKRDLVIKTKIIPPQIMVGGSGGLYLAQNNFKTRELLDLIKANNSKRVSDLAVADYLARINFKVHEGIPDKTVGPRCIVAWRHRKEGIFRGGGGHQMYSRTERDRDNPALPDISLGLDVRAMCNLLLARFLEKGGFSDESLFDKEEMNKELAKLPDGPDETLR